MKLRSPILFILLLILTYFTFYHPTKLLIPFNYLKDLLFSVVHADTKDISLSSEFEENIINSLKEDINELKKLNNITLSISEFDKVNATVIERNREYWFNSITVNKGSSDGIEVDMAVIDSNGLIGRIEKVTNNTSMIKLITTNDTKNKVSALIKNKNEKIYGIINGYDNKNNLLNLIITDNKKIEEGSIVETTGMGGVFPGGILIGKVYDEIKKDDGVTNVVRVRLSSNIEGEKYVSILKRQKDASN